MYETTYLYELGVQGHFQYYKKQNILVYLKDKLTIQTKNKFK